MAFQGSRMKKKIELDVFLGDQDRWIVAVKFMEIADKLYGTNTIRSTFILDSITGMVS